jgi:ABC transport system ATP-binding/permease protein
MTCFGVNKFPKLYDTLSPQWQKLLSALRFIPGIGRLRSLRRGSDALMGPLIDVFAAFTTLDNQVDEDEIDLALDLLRAAFPEVDHGWLARRLQRSVKFPRSIENVAEEFRERLDDTGKLALGLQLWALVYSADCSEESRDLFNRFMDRLGKPEYGKEILEEMNDATFGDHLCSIERVSFTSEVEGDVALPAKAAGHEFSVYRVGDLVMVRNTGRLPLWVRGRSVESGTFLRMRDRQALVVPGWTIMYEDFVHFLNVRKTGLGPKIFVTAGDEGITVGRTKTRQSLAVLRFGTSVEVEALRECDLELGNGERLLLGKPVSGAHHVRLIDPDGASVSLEDLRKRALAAGGRFRITNLRRSFLVSNDPSQIDSGDLLLSPRLAPRVVMRMRYAPEEQCGYVEVIESDEAVTIEGNSIRGEVRVNDGVLIRFSSRQSLRCRFSEQLIEEEKNLIETLAVENLIHDFSGDVRALDHLNFKVRRGEMLCIIGPSGSGKSTLLTALSGQLEPTRGDVLLNDVSLYDHRNKLVRFIARMGQEEALFSQLTVREHLRHAASIRRPHQSAADRERRIDIVLADLSLQGLAHRQVGSPGEKTLSGGERSRLNLGLDLVSAAELYLLDEPISGLSSKDSEHVAETLRALARDKIVIASLHRPGAQVLRLFDKVLLLDSGGRLAYFGTPAMMIEYFHEACRELEISHPAIMAQNPLGADFVFDILETPLNTIGGGQNPMAARRFPPTFWQHRYESENLFLSLNGNEESLPKKFIDERKEGSIKDFPQQKRRRIREIFSIFVTHFQRAILSKVRTRGMFNSALLEAPLLGLLIAVTLRSSPIGSYEFSTALHIPAFLFLSVTVAMFLGLTNSATEILRDKPIIRREQNCYPGAFLYITAKFLALSFIAAAQCLIYLIITHGILQIYGTLLEQWMWMTLTALIGTAMALLVSSFVKTERAALTAVPLLLVPQMLLAGALVPYREMNRALFDEVHVNKERGGTPIPAQIMPLRYAYEAMVVSQATRNPFDKERIRIQRQITELAEQKILTKESAERLEILKISLTKLLGGGALTAEKAQEMAFKISKVGRRGEREACEKMKVWSGEEGLIKPLSSYFVNERIDLLTTEADAFRTDIRNGKNRSIYLALKQPFLDGKWLETTRRNGLLLILFMISCLFLAGYWIARGKRQVR